MISIIQMLYKVRDWTNNEIGRIQSECTHDMKQTDYTGDSRYDGYWEYFTYTCEICDKKTYKSRQS